MPPVIQRGLARELPDVPGALGTVAALLGRAGANIVEVAHQRAFAGASARSVEVQFLLHLRGERHLAEVVQTLERAGYPARVDPPAPPSAGVAS